MNGRIDLKKMLELTGERLSRDLRDSLVEHPGELGRDREEIIRSCLRSNLPARFEVSHGFVFDAAGKMSQQLDIVIADARTSPVFQTQGGIRYFPCECVLAVGQVKSAVDSARKLGDALDNLKSVKALDRSGFGTTSTETPRTPLRPSENHLDQIFTFLIITGRSISGKGVIEFLSERILREPPEHWTNIILALNKYLITFCCEAGICPNPLDARGIALQQKTKDIDVWVRFYRLLAAALDVTRTSNLAYWEYLKDIDIWDAEVRYYAGDELPPLLSSLPRM